MMYLSFSPIFLVCVIVVWSGVMFFVNRSKAVSLKQSVVTYIGGLLVIGFLAVDVGQPRSQIDRTQFNKEVTTEIVEKTESSRVDAKSVQLEHKKIDKEQTNVISEK